MEKTLESNGVEIIKRLTELSGIKKMFRHTPLGIHLQHI